MYDLEDLYQDIVIDHNSRPRNFRKLEGANRTAEGFNPLCGDKINLYLNVEDDLITDVGFVGAGCAISKASSSMMTESIKFQKVEDARKIFAAFRGMITQESQGERDSDLLGDLEILEGVSAYPARIKCATLAWHTLSAALDGKTDSAKAE